MSRWLLIYSSLKTKGGPLVRKIFFISNTNNNGIKSCFSVYLGENQRENFHVSPLSSVNFRNVSKLAKHCITTFYTHIYNYLDTYIVDICDHFFHQGSPLWIFFIRNWKSNHLDMFERTKFGIYGILIYLCSRLHPN